MKLMSNDIFLEKVYSIFFSHDRYLNKLVDVYKIEEELWHGVLDIVEPLCNLKYII